METTQKIKKSERESHTRVSQMARTINREFRIKVYGFFNGRKVDHLVGISGLTALIGLNNSVAAFDRAMNSMDDKCQCKFRRGVSVTFYRK